MSRLGRSRTRPSIPFEAAQRSRSQPRYSFGEVLAVEDEPESGAQGLSFYFGILAQLLLTRFQRVRETLAGVGVPGAGPTSLLPPADELRATIATDSDAIGRYSEAIRERLIDEPIAAAEAFQTLATIVSTSDSARAANLFQAAADIYQQEGEHRAQVVVLGELARLKALGGHTSDAVKFHQSTLGILERLGDIQAREAALNEIARLQLESRGAVSAGPLARLARVFLTRAGAVEWRNTLSFLFDRVAGAYTDLEKAVDLFEFLVDQVEEDDVGLQYILADAAQILLGRDAVLRPATVDRLRHVLLSEVAKPTTTPSDKTALESALVRLGRS